MTDLNQIKFVKKPRRDSRGLAFPFLSSLQSAMVSSLDVQRLFLQSVISRRVLSADLAKVLWEQCVQAVKGLVLCPLQT
jgi:hypothetical protein